MLANLYAFESEGPPPPPQLTGEGGPPAGGGVVWYDPRYYEDWLEQYQKQQQKPFTARDDDRRALVETVIEAVRGKPAEPLAKSEQTTIINAVRASLDLEGMRTTAKEIRAMLAKVEYERLSYLRQQADEMLAIAMLTDTI
jgi:hypothetical protein